MEDNRYPVHSPLSQRLSRDGTTVAIQIYDDGQGGWLLEVVDEFGNSTVWDESFQTDKAALAEVLNTYRHRRNCVRDWNRADHYYAQLTDNCILPR